MGKKDNKNVVINIETAATENNKNTNDVKWDDRFATFGNVNFEAVRT